jgi:hypothetical protein
MEHCFDAQEFDMFRDSFSKKFKTSRLLFEINTINRSYTIDIILLDENDQPLYRVRFDVPAYSGTHKLVNRNF